MFRLLRRRAPVVKQRETLLELSNEQVFDLLNSKLDQLIGKHGQWTLVRRTENDTDVIFHAILSHQIAAELTRTVDVGLAQLRGDSRAEKSALDWNPEPLTLVEEVKTLMITDGTENRRDASSDVIAVADSNDSSARKEKLSDGTEKHFFDGMVAEKPGTDFLKNKNAHKKTRKLVA